MNIGEDRILDFLDGRLAVPDEEELLHTLAISPERRQVLRAHINLRQMTNSLARDEQFNVPEGLTSRLFDRLTGLGYSAPVSASDILSGAPEFISSPITDGVSNSVAAIAASGAVGLSGGWRFGTVWLLTASLISFILGAGAYYVFGAALGLRTHSEEIAATRLVPKHFATLAGPAGSYDMPASHVLTSLTARMPGSSPVGPSKVTSSSIVGQMLPYEPIAIAETPHEAPPSQDVSTSPSVMPAITSTAPRVPVAMVSLSAPKNITGGTPLWADAIPSPMAQDRGTISVRFALGPAPQATDAPVSTLSEFRFGWKIGYFVGGASMGQLNSIERTAQATPKNPSELSKGIVISTPENPTPVSTTLIGLDAGITLDPLGVPVDAMVGFLYSGVGSSSGYSTLYDRASLMIHFQPWRELTVSGGIEGLWYTHELTNSIENQKKLNAHYTSTLSPAAVSQETCGLVGPTIEFGWHF